MPDQNRPARAAAPGNVPVRPTVPASRTIAEIAGLLGIEPLDPTFAGVVVTGLSLSSQRVQPGDLYAALPGARAHGADYAADALARGSSAVLTDPAGAERLAGAPPGSALPVLVVERPRALLGQLAAFLYDDPANALTLLAVTGTQGKTTTTRLLEAALTSSGRSAAVIGTVGTRIGGVEVKTALTTPEAPDLQALFAVMVERGVEVCAMEVSSHALVMGRVDGVVFDMGVFLNLGRDHLDFHTDEEDYFRAKASLFTPERLRLGLTNLDDPYGRRLLGEATVPMRTFAVDDDSADWRAVDVDLGPEGSVFVVVTPDGDRVPARVPLPGAFNVSNALGALALAGEAGLALAPIAAAMGAGGGVPGRLEKVEEGQDFLAVVDYAHKPDAVDAVLAALRPLTAGRLILVIGAGGDRDPGKRPLMGAIGARAADVLVVTDDNPRTEDPVAIRAAVLAGAAGGGAEVVELGDRRTAIAWAIGVAEPGDAVVVAGKGHETGQEIAGVVQPFDDRDEVRTALRSRAAAGVGHNVPAEPGAEPGAGPARADDEEPRV